MKLAQLKMQDYDLDMNLYSFNTIQLVNVPLFDIERHSKKA